MTYHDQTKPPFRADHVGSLLRPQAIHDARMQLAAGEITAHELAQVEDDCIRHAIRRQEEAGIRAVTDGEFRRTSWHYDFLCSLEGVEQTAPHQGPTFKDGHAINSLEITGKIRNPGGIMLDHFRFLKQHVRQTVPSYSSQACAGMSIRPCPMLGLSCCAYWKPDASAREKVVRPSPTRRVSISAGKPLGRNF